MTNPLAVLAVAAQLSMPGLAPCREPGMPPKGALRYS